MFGKVRLKLCTSKPPLFTLYRDKTVTESLTAIYFGKVAIEKMKTRLLDDMFNQT